MNFKRCNEKKTLLEDFYEHFDEDGRLDSRHGKIEFEVTFSYVLKALEGGPKKILDVGAGTGRYSIPLFNLGHDVTAIELVEHNIEKLRKKCPDMKSFVGNALDLSRFDDETFDVVLVFGPMYHLFSFEDRLSALLEAKRVLKKGGKLLVAYYMNEYAVMSYGFLRGHILESIREGRLDEDYHYVPKDGDIYSMVRISDIDELNAKADLEREKIISADGLADYFRVELNQMDEDTYLEFIRFSKKIAERPDLIGWSAHTVDILKKS